MRVAAIVFSKLNETLTAYLNPKTTCKNQKILPFQGHGSTPIYHHSFEERVALIVFSKQNTMLTGYFDPKKTCWHQKNAYLLGRMN